jgi:hypothetical protein
LEYSTFSRSRLTGREATIEVNLQIKGKDTALLVSRGTPITVLPEGFREEKCLRMRTSKPREEMENRA